MEVPSPDDASELCFAGVLYAVGAHESLSFISLINRDSTALLQQGRLLEPGEAQSEALWKEESFQLGPRQRPARRPARWHPSAWLLGTREPHAGVMSVLALEEAEPSRERRECRL